MKKNTPTKKILKHIKLKYYDIIHEEIDTSYYGGQGTMISKYAQSKEGHYIGESFVAYRLVHKYGITKFELRDSMKKVISIGYSPKYRKWYGWSHRALYGFTVGSKVKKGDCGYIPATLEEHIENMKQFWETKDVKVKGRNIEVKREGSDLTSIHKIKDLPIGKGQWQAKTLADAKQMAIDFSSGVS